MQSVLNFGQNVSWRLLEIISADLLDALFMLPTGVINPMMMIKLTLVRTRHLDGAVCFDNVVGVRQTGLDFSDASAASLRQLDTRCRRVVDQSYVCAHAQ